MKRFNNLSDIRLAERIAMLKRDVEDFTARAAREAAALERAGRCAVADPLHQRLTSIRAHLRDELASAEQAARLRSARARARSPQPLTELVLTAIQTLLPVRYQRRTAALAQTTRSTR